MLTLGCCRAALGSWLHIPCRFDVLSLMMHACTASLIVKLSHSLSRAPRFSTVLALPGRHETPVCAGAPSTRVTPTRVLAVLPALAATIRFLLRTMNIIMYLHTRT